MRQYSYVGQASEALHSPPSAAAAAASLGLLLLLPVQPHASPLPAGGRYYYSSRLSATTATIAGASVEAMRYPFLTLTLTLDASPLRGCLWGGWC